MIRMISMSAVLLSVVAATVVAQERQKTPTAKAPGKNTISLDSGKIKLAVPDGWEKKKPRSRILSYEFSIPSKAEGEKGGRFTVSTMRGSVKANVDRWVKQFPVATAKKVQEKKIGEHAVHTVDLSGTFLDARGPAFPAVKREGYRMMGAIIPTKNGSSHFLKFYGPQKVIAKHAESFEKMLQSLKQKTANDGK